jgi:S-methylmethionine-dependent homocysteine/selenocysteine methylase
MLGAMTPRKESKKMNSALLAGLTPQAVIRTLGPWGAQLCDGYVSRRFGAGLPPAEVEFFRQYFYQQLAAKVSPPAACATTLLRHSVYALKHTCT